MLLKLTLEDCLTCIQFGITLERAWYLINHQTFFLVVSLMSFVRKNFSALTSLTMELCLFEQIDETPGYPRFFEVLHAVWATALLGQPRVDARCTVDSIAIIAGLHVKAYNVRTDWADKLLHDNSMLLNSVIKANFWLWV